MKKILTFAVVLTALTMVSCGGNANRKAAAETQEVPAVTEETCEQATECVQGDSTCCEEACETATVEVQAE